MKTLLIIGLLIGSVAAQEGAPSAVTEATPTATPKKSAKEQLKEARTIIEQKSQENAKKLAEMRANRPLSKQQLRDIAWKKEALGDLKFLKRKFFANLKLNAQEEEDLLKVGKQLRELLFNPEFQESDLDLELLARVKIGFSHNLNLAILQLGAGMAKKLEVKPNMVPKEVYDQVQAEFASFWEPKNFISRKKFIERAIFSHDSVYVPILKEHFTPKMKAYISAHPEKFPKYRKFIEVENKLGAKGTVKDYMNALSNGKYGSEAPVESGKAKQALQKIKARAKELKNRSESPLDFAKYGLLLLIPILFFVLYKKFSK